MPLRLRLGLAFAVLLLLVVAQMAGIVRLVGSAEQQRQGSMVARDMLQQMTSFAANKQRLKVWYAQALLTGEKNALQRDLLLAAMAASIAELQGLADRQVAAAVDRNRAGAADARGTVSRLERNFRAFRARIVAVDEPGEAQRVRAWQEMLEVFDLTEGRDMRLEVGAAIQDQARRSDAAEVAAQQALAQVRQLLLASVALTLAVCVAFVAYFVMAIRRPVDALLDGARRLGEGQLGHRIGWVGAGPKDEFAALSRGFDAMAGELQHHRDRLENAVQARTTELAARSAELQAANARLEALDRTRRQFFADVSHELRTPTTAMLGEAEIALRGPDRAPAEYRDTLQRVAGAARVLASRIRDLLQLARAEDPTLASRHERLDLRLLLVQVLEQHEHAAATAGVALLPHEETGPCWVLGDAQRLTQLLDVLLDNAVAYTPRGGRVAAKLCTLPAQAGLSDTAAQHELVIEDSGIGLESTPPQALFERHARGRQARVLRPDGAGLGLSIAQAIALAHGAVLSLRPRSGGGTEAVLRLPVPGAGR